MRDYLQSYGQVSIKGINLTHGNSGASLFSPENPLKFIKETSDKYIEAHFVDGSYVGFGGEAYDAVVALAGTAQEQA